MKLVVIFGCVLLGLISVSTLSLPVTQQDIDEITKLGMETSTKLFQNLNKRHHEPFHVDDCGEGKTLNSEGICEPKTSVGTDTSKLEGKPTPTSSDIRPDRSECPKNYVKDENGCLIIRSRVASSTPSSEPWPTSDKKQTTEEKSCKPGQFLNADGVCELEQASPRQDSPCGSGSVRLLDGNCIPEKNTKEAVLKPTAVTSIPKIEQPTGKPSPVATKTPSPLTFTSAPSVEKRSESSEFTTVSSFDERSEPSEFTTVPSKDKRSETLDFTTVPNMGERSEPSEFTTVPSKDKRSETLDFTTVPNMGERSEPSEFTTVPSKDKRSETLDLTTVSNMQKRLESSEYTTVVASPAHVERIEEFKKTTVSGTPTSS